MCLTKFTIGQRNSLKLIYDGYCYTKSYMANSTIKWVCSTKNYTRCRARVRLNKDMTVVPIITEHNHERKKSGYRNIMQCTPKLVKTLFKETTASNEIYLEIDIDSDDYHEH